MICVCCGARYGLSEDRLQDLPQYCRPCAVSRCDYSPCGINRDLNSKFTSKSEGARIEISRERTAVYDTQGIKIHETTFSASEKERIVGTNHRAAGECLECGTTLGTAWRNGIYVGSDQRKYNGPPWCGECKPYGFWQCVRYYTWVRFIFQGYARAVNATVRALVYTFGDEVAIRRWKGMDG